MAKIQLLTSYHSNLEWVGTLLYQLNKTEKGTLYINLIDLYPLNYGSQGVVESLEKYAVNSKKYYLEKYGFNYHETYLEGIIHSHNTMQTFFSGTDQIDFEKFAKTNVTISIVTNNKLEFYGKIGMPIETILGKKVWEEELSFVVDYGEPPKEFSELVQELADARTKAIKKRKTTIVTRWPDYSNYNNYNGYGTQKEIDFDDDFDDDFESYLGGFIEELKDTYLIYTIRANNGVIAYYDIQQLCSKNNISITYSDYVAHLPLLKKYAKYNVILEELEKKAMKKNKIDKKLFLELAEQKLGKENLDYAHDYLKFITYEL